MFFYILPHLLQCTPNILKVPPSFVGTVLSTDAETCFLLKIYFDQAVASAATSTRTLMNLPRRFMSIPSLAIMGIQ